MKSWDIIGYTYKADIYCPGCITTEVEKDYPDVELVGTFSTESDLFQLADKLGINYVDQYSYDTDNFPKVILAQDEDCHDDNCAICHERLVEE